MRELSPESKERFRTLAEVVRTNYKLFDMRHWAKTNCTTTGCLAGIAVIHFAEEEWDTYEDGLKALVNREPRDNGDDEIVARGSAVRPLAEKLLIISEFEAEKVFFPGHWTQKHRLLFNAAKTQRQKARVASDYLLAIADGKVTITSSWIYAELVGPAGLEPTTKGL